ncbi:hypothetical protein A2U01_0074949, partial [Trifolium medium]|nr:hypothetical protein [Trifolium medium]
MRSTQYEDQTPRRAWNPVTPGVTISFSANNSSIKSNNCAARHAFLR